MTWKNLKTLSADNIQESLLNRRSLSCLDWSGHLRLKSALSASAREGDAEQYQLRKKLSRHGQGRRGLDQGACRTSQHLECRSTLTAHRLIRPSHAVTRTHTHRQDCGSGLWSAATTLSLLSHEGSGSQPIETVDETGAGPENKLQVRS